MSEKEKNDTAENLTDQPQNEKSVKKEKVENPAKSTAFFPREGITREI